MKLITIICAILLASTTFAQNDAGSASKNNATNTKQFTKDEIGGLFDPQWFLNTDSQKNLRKELALINDNNEHKIYVAVLKSMQGEDLENLNHIIKTIWNLKPEKQNKAALLLIALKEQELRIQLTPSLEPLVSKESKDEIISGILIKNFGAANYYTGLADSVKRINELILKSPQ